MHLVSLVVGVLTLDFLVALRAEDPGGNCHWLRGELVGGKREQHQIVGAVHNKYVPLHSIRASSGSAAAEKPAVKILISRAVILTSQPRLKQKKLGKLGGLTS